MPVPIAIVSNGITPYGVHFLHRVSRELEKYRLKTIYSHEFSMGQWSIDLPDSIDALVLGKGERALVLKGLPHLCCGWRRGREIIEALKGVRPAAVMVLGYGDFSHVVVINWCKRKGIPCLLMGDSNIRGDNNSGLKAIIKKAVVGRIVSWCSAVLPCGSLGAQYFQKYGAQKNQIFLVPNEPDYSLIENMSDEIITEMAQAFELVPHRSRIFFSGRLVPLKRVDLLLGTFFAIADKRPQWDLLIAGDGPLKAELTASVPPRLRERIKWTGFVDTPQRMAALYKLCDVMVLPSDYEPWALVVNEAVCSGLALVCSDVVGAAAELLRDGENGRVFAASDIASLTTALLDVTDDNNVSRYKSRSKELLREWQQKADPVEGFARALDYCLTLPGSKDNGNYTKTRTKCSMERRSL